MFVETPSVFIGVHQVEEYSFGDGWLATTLQKLKPGLNILLGVTYVLIVVAAFCRQTYRHCASDE